MRVQLAKLFATFLFVSVVNALKLTPRRVRLSAPPIPDFDTYVVQFNRGYNNGSDEYHLRHEQYKQQVEAIKRHNSRPDILWVAAVNRLTDRTKKEREQLRGYKRHGSGRGHKGEIRDGGLIQTKIEPSLEWQHLHMADKIPDQEECGSCWAVATVSMLQARFEAHTKKRRTFSAQQLVSCAPNPKACGGDGGCDGSTVELAMEYVDAAGLKDSSSSGEPYFGKNGTCKEPMPNDAHEASLRNNVRAQLGLSSWRKLPVNKIAPLLTALRDGPVAISLSATDDWGMYNSGIFNSCEKDTVVNHATVLFGYGSENGVNYWRVRNSWGSAWGEKGYIRMLRQSDSADEERYCGWDHNPKEGTDCKPYPDKVKVCGMCGMLYDSVEAHFSPDASVPQATDGDDTGTFKGSGTYITSS